MTDSDALILKCYGHTPALDAFLLNELYTETHLASLSLFFFFFFNLYHKQIASIMERKPDWIWIFFFFNASSSVMFIYPDGRYPLR